MKKISVLVLFLHYNTISTANILLHDTTSKKALEVGTSFRLCEVYTDEKEIHDIISNMDQSDVYNVDKENFDRTLHLCLSLNKKGLSTHGITFPCTKWCGPGDTAKNYDDLGFCKQEDKCCRAHDHCPLNILSGKCIYNYCNYGLFTLSHCDCDKELHICLKNVGSTMASVFEALYFKVASMKCFTLDCEGDNCKVIFQDKKQIIEQPVVEDVPVDNNQKNSLIDYTFKILYLPKKLLSVGVNFVKGIIFKKQYYYM